MGGGTVRPITSSPQNDVAIRISGSLHYSSHAMLGNTKKAVRVPRGTNTINCDLYIPTRPVLEPNWA